MAASAGDITRGAAGATVSGNLLTFTTDIFAQIPAVTAAHDR